MTDKLNFAITGVAGYIAPRHLKAIKETGHTVVAALDPHDSVGILDGYFPAARFFTEFERFDRYAEKLKRQGENERVNFVSICSPNYLHDAHIRFALRLGAHAICEKPIVLNPWNIDALQELETESGKKVYTVLQLRHHPLLIDLKKKLATSPAKKKHAVTLTYITPRGAWYHTSWKGQLEKSGGLATNIGIHFFDLLIWLFGAKKRSEVHYSTPRQICGFLELKNADVQWFLSTDKNDLPEEIKEKGQSTFRVLAIDGNVIEFSEGFTNLHLEVYRQILAGGGLGLKDAKPSVILTHDIRNAVPVGSNANAHPFSKKIK